MPLTVNPDWSQITNKPTTLAGLGVAAGDALFASVTAGNASAVPYAGVSGKPTTVAGYGITDAVKADNGTGAVGSFILASKSATGGIADGATVAGSSLNGGVITNAGVWTASVALTGTWRNVSGGTQGPSGSNVGVWQRIA